MKVNVYNQDIFKSTSIYNDSNVENRLDQYFICINSSGYIHSIPHFHKEHFNVHNTFFDDTEYDRIKVSGDIVYFAKACTDNQAKSIKQFIDTIPEHADVHVYCAKGKSRSTAVAKFIEEYKGVENKTEFKTYNSYVYNLLWKQI